MEKLMKMAGKKISEFSVKGICNAPVTAFTPCGELDTDIVPKYIDHMVEFGVLNAFVNGTNGEGLSLTVDERKKHAEAWVKGGKGKLNTIIIQIGGGNIKESIELAKHAQDIGADAISCVGPTYFKPTTNTDYVNYMKEVAAAAPDVPFYLYDIDFVTGITLNVNDFFKLAKDQIPTLRGVKHTSPNFPSMHTLLEEHKGAVDVLLGSNEIYLEALSIGMECTIMNSYNGHVLNRLREAFHRGDMKAARKEQARALAVGNIRNKHGLWVPDGSKAMMKAIGLDLGQPRLPVSPLSDDLIVKLKADLTEIGFFEWGMKK